MGNYDLVASNAIPGLEGVFTASANDHTVKLNERARFGRYLLELYKVTSIDGLLDTPQVRGDRQQMAGDHGSYRGNQFLDERVVALNGEAIAGNFDKLREMQRELATIGGPTQPVPATTGTWTPQGYLTPSGGDQGEPGSLVISPPDRYGIGKPNVKIGTDYGFNWLLNPDFDPDYPTQTHPGPVELPYDWDKSAGVALTNVDVTPNVGLWGNSAGRITIGATGGAGDQWIGPGWTLWGNTLPRPTARLMPVYAGSSWHAACTVNIAQLTTGARVQLRLSSYDNAGTFISSLTSAYVTSGVNHLSLGGALPANASYVEMRLVVNFNAAGQTADLTATNFVLGQGDTYRWPLFPSHPATYQAKTEDGRAPDGYAHGPRPHNMLQEPSFERSTSGWRTRTNANVTFDRSSIVFRDAISDDDSPLPITGRSDKDGRKYSARLTKTISTGPLMIEQDVPASPGLEYSFSYYARSESVVRTMGAYLDWWDQSGAGISTTPSVATIADSNGWTRVTVSGVAPANTVRVNVRASTTGNISAGEVWFVDDAMFNVGKLVDYGDEFTPGWRDSGRFVRRLTNLFKNPDSASATLSTYFANGGSNAGLTITGPVVDSTWWGPYSINKNSVRFAATNPDATARTAILSTGPNTTNAIPVVAGKTYYASSFMHAVTMTGLAATVGINFDIKWINAAGATISDTSDQPAFGPGDFFLERHAVAPAGAAYAALRWYVTFAAAGTMDISVDNVMFAETIDAVRYVSGDVVGNWDGAPDDSTSTVYSNTIRTVVGSQLPPPVEYELTKVDFDVKQSERQDSSTFKRPFMVTARCADPRIYIKDPRGVVVQPRTALSPYISHRNPGTFAGTTFTSPVDTDTGVGGNQPVPIDTASGYTEITGIPSGAQDTWIYRRVPTASVNSKTRMAFTEFKFNRDNSVEPEDVNSYVSTIVRYKDSSNYLEGRYFTSGMLRVVAVVAGVTYTIDEYQHFQYPLGTTLYLRVSARDDGADVWLSASVHDRKPGPSANWWADPAGYPGYGYATGMYIGNTLTAPQIAVFQGAGPYYNGWGLAEDYVAGGTVGSFNTANPRPFVYGWDEHEMNPSSLTADINVGGNIDVPFKLLIDGPVVNPFVVDNNGSFKVYTDVTLDAGSSMEIDLINGKISGVNDDPMFPGGFGQASARNVLQGSTLTNMNPGDHKFTCGGSGMTAGTYNDDSTRFSFFFRDALR